MTRVASLYLPQLPIERLRGSERPARPLEPNLWGKAPLGAIDDDPGACSVPRGGGWRPGARWARDGALGRKAPQDEIEALASHQRPTMREMGRRSELADHPFKAMRPDDGAPGLAHSIGSVTLAGSGRPRVLIERVGQRDVVTAVCPLARTLGLHPGMAAAHARALIVDLEIGDADVAADRALLDRLALHAVRHWTPNASVTETRDAGDGIWLDLTGTTHLFGGEERFCQRLVRFLARLGFSAAIAVAGTPGAAYALARHGGSDMILLPPGTETQAIADLPVAALRIDGESLAAAARFGFVRIGDLYPIPRGPLAKRLGMEAVRRLDQARGLAAEPIAPVVPFEQPCAARRLLEPITTPEAIAQVMGDLVDDLVAQLQARGLGVRALALSSTRVDDDQQRLALGTARATRDAAHLKRMLVMRIDRLEPGLGIESFELAAPRVESLEPAALSASFARDGAGGDLAQLVDQLAARVGEDAMFRVQAMESDVPERAVCRVAPLAKPAGWPRWQRPVRLLRRPERLSGVLALLPDHPPRRFIWRRKAYEIVAGDGPERVHGEWWRSAREMWAVRDYFRVEATGGERFWIFRRGDGVEAPTGDLSWFLQGIFG